ncbi:gamma-glutamyltransferase, partial [Halocaridina rubra]
ILQYARILCTIPEKRRCCHGNDGFTVISVCFFVLTVAITFALIIQIHYGSPEVTPHGAVATDAEECSHVGITIMKQGGSAVDVAIASLLCMTVVHPHVVGPGGSGVMLVHDHKSNKTVIIDFMSDVPESHRADLPVPDITDGRSIGIPGLMRGLQYAHSKFGKVPWASLFAPSVKFAREGFNVSAHLDKSYRKLDNTQVHGITPFEKTFYPRGVKLKAGDFIKREKYAEFLKTIALNGGDSFYLLDFGAEEMRAITEAGADIHVREFENYEVRERSCIHMALRNNTLFTAPAPFGGPQLMLALKMLDSINSTQLYSDSVLYHSLVEAIRQSYAKFIKLAEEEEPNLQNITQQLLNVSDASVDTSITTDDPLLPQMPEQAATTVSVIDTFDQYVTAVAGLGTYFGSQVMTEHGILFNNHLANLPTPSSPEKGFSRARPLTPYTPVIITDVKKVCGQRVVLSSPEVGAVVQVVSQLLFRDEDLAQAIGKPRLHVKPGMMKVNVEALGNAPPLPGDVHNLLNATYGLHPLLEPYASVDGISKIKDKLLSWSDVRGGGVAHRLEPVSHLSSDGVGEV